MPVFAEAHLTAADLHPDDICRLLCISADEYGILLANAKTKMRAFTDIFDKLDARRVEQIMHLVSGDIYGQIFITDTHREHLDEILRSSTADYKVFHVENGVITEM